MVGVWRYRLRTAWRSSHGGVSVVAQAARRTSGRVARVSCLVKVAMVLILVRVKGSGERSKNVKRQATAGTLMAPEVPLCLP
jgi:hypothetical protein